MTIAAILRTKGDDVIALTPQTRVGEAVAVLAEKRIGAVPVCDDGVPVGIFSERDVVHCLAQAGAGALDRPLSEVMTQPVQSVGAQENVIGALSLMTRRRIRHLPVVEDGRWSASSRSAIWSNTASTGSRRMPRRCATISSRDRTGRTTPSGRQRPLAQDRDQLAHGAAREQREPAAIGRAPTPTRIASCTGGASGGSSASTSRTTPAITAAAITAGANRPTSASGATPITGSDRQLLTARYTG